MKSLQCVAITDGRVFVVDIDDCKNVWFLMDMIQKHKVYNFPGHHLKLYVAKKDGEWLKPDDPDVLRLENGESSSGIAALMNDSSKMNPDFCMENAAFGFPDEDNVGEDEIHVLVDVPQYAKRGPQRKLLHCLKAKPERKKICYAAVSLLFVVFALYHLFTIGECFVAKAGRSEKCDAFVCVFGTLLSVFSNVIMGSITWDWYEEARSEEEHREEQQSRLQIGYGPVS